MSHTCSAEPERLFSYASYATTLDGQLEAQGRRLSGIVQTFERGCRESGLRLSTGTAGEGLASYAKDNLLGDQKVREVGLSFARADAQHMASPSASTWRNEGTQLSTRTWKRAAVVASFVLFPGVATAVWLIPKIYGFLRSIGQDTGIPRLGVEQPAPTPEPQKVVSAPTVKAENIPASDSAIRAYEHQSQAAGVLSNCTWYAAAAVRAASEGKINVGSYSLGDASRWAVSARAAIDETHKEHNTYKRYQDAISSVDRMPSVSSVYCSGDHVAFVEEVRYLKKDGKQLAEVVISEENYYVTQVFSGSKPVDIPDHPEVKRWRRTKQFEIVDGQIPSGQGEFIHLNYDGS